MISVLVDILCLPNSGYFEKTGVFQQPRLTASTINPIVTCEGAAVGYFGVDWLAE
jgi:hypothetical protein